MDETVKFKLGGSRFDQTVFSGRFRHVLGVMDPRTLLTSDHDLKKAMKLLNQYKDGTISESVTDEELWRAQKIKQAILHPDTGKKIPMPFRMSGFVPFGSAIVVGLLLPHRTLLSSAFWHWLNQSNSACFNYSNGNATQRTNTNGFLMGYIGATSTVVGITLGLNVLLRKSTKLKSMTRGLIQRLIPYPAVAVASVCNVVLMRHSELYTGIEVVDSQDKVVGVSQVAAAKALKETSATRAFLPAPILLIPPTVMTLLERTKWFRRYPYLSLPAQIVLTTSSFALALSIAAALFPQKPQIHADLLEPSIRNATSESTLFYNKGL